VKRGTGGASLHRVKTRASRLEILGAWLHLWTPPRDVEVPPVPWRKVAAGAALVGLAALAFALVAAPVIDDAKDEGAAERQREEERIQAERRERLRVEQLPRRGRSGSLPAVEAAIGADAEKRFGADGRPADCERAPGAKVTEAGVLYDCHVTIREIVAGGDQEGAQGALTVPYRARLDRKEGRYAFCKTNPRPGEQALQGPESIIELPPVCHA
jgi:hypothetical protein